MMRHDLRHHRRRRWAKDPEKSIWRMIRQSKDPTVFTVIFEDSAALLGLIAALLGFFLGHRLGNHYLDGAASLVIGSILVCVAVLLIYESKGLLVGESSSANTVRGIRRLTQN
jgi:divalent metal cation (Fe/Co/Zn/Cd) transporter